jgi:hypothetical protein
MKSLQSVGLVGVLLASVYSASSQNVIQFTGASVTDELAIRLSWSSTNGELYQVQFANAFNTNADGSTAWQTLCDQYPSHGTNTFWLDTGNYNFSPSVPHPKYQGMRFYRIVDLGADSLSDEPGVVITGPTSGSTATGDLTVTVTAYTDQPVISWTKLYVDGQEMRGAVATTNYTIGSTNYQTDTYVLNTCEWGNKSHTLFATVGSQSGYGDATDSSAVYAGHGVSPYVPVTFSNLINRISFSQVAFDPSVGQTQTVSAVFAANCNWTMDIKNVYSNSVRTVTGSGTSMAYNWNGTGTGGTNLPVGIYYYFISAQTNSLPSDSMSMEMASESEASPWDFTTIFAVPADGSGGAVPLILYPPGYDTNNLILFEASQSDLMPKSITTAAMSPSDYASDYSGASSQSSSGAPQRPPTDPIIGIAGYFGVANDTFSGNGPGGYGIPPLDNGLNIHMYISFEGKSASGSRVYPPIEVSTPQANGFVDAMQQFGWRCGFRKTDNQFSINDLRGSGTMFNSVKIGVLLTHCTYGTSIDYAANQCKQMYFAITSGNGAQYLRMSEMNLGGPGTNGLKWMALFGCNSLQHTDWSSMQSSGVYPYNSNLHLLLGSDSIVYSSSVILKYWGQYMCFGRNGFSPMTIHDAWYQSAQDAYRGHNYGNTMKFAIAGDSACMGDYVQPGASSNPGGSWTYNSQQVWP